MACKGSAGRGAVGRGSTRVSSSPLPAAPHSPHKCTNGSRSKFWQTGGGGAAHKRYPKREDTQSHVVCMLRCSSCEVTHTSLFLSPRRSLFHSFVQVFVHARSHIHTLSTRGHTCTQQPRPHAVHACILPRPPGRPPCSCPLRSSAVLATRRACRPSATSWWPWRRSWARSRRT